MCWYRSIAIPLPFFRRELFCLAQFSLYALSLWPCIHLRFWGADITLWVFEFRMNLQRGKYNDELRYEEARRRGEAIAETVKIEFVAQRADGKEITIELADKLTDAMFGFLDNEGFVAVGSIELSPDDTISPESVGNA